MANLQPTISSSYEIGKGVQEKCRSVCEKKRRKDTNAMLSSIETLVYSSKPLETPSKKVGKIQILEKACKFIRFYNKLVKGRESPDVPSVIPPNILQALFTYSQKGFLLVTDSTGQVVCCSGSAMGCLERPDTMIVGTKLSQLLTTNDSDFVMSLISEKRGECIPFFLHFNFVSGTMHTFSCRAFWHNFADISSEPEQSESDIGMGALILACSSIDKLSMYYLPIFNSDKALEFEFNVSLDGKFTKVDEGVEKYTGYTSTDLIGRCILDYVNWEQTVELMNAMARAIKLCTKASGCLQFCCKSKSWIWIKADIGVSQNLWNSRVDSLTFSCKALDYNEVIGYLTNQRLSTFSVTPPNIGAEPGGVGGLPGFESSPQSQYKHLV